MDERASYSTVTSTDHPKFKKYKWLRKSVSLFFRQTVICQYYNNQHFHTIPILLSFHKKGVVLIINLPTQMDLILVEHNQYVVYLPLHKTTGIARQK